MLCKSKDTKNGYSNMGMEYNLTNLILTAILAVLIVLSILVTALLLRIYHAINYVNNTIDHYESQINQNIISINDNISVMISSSVGDDKIISKSIFRRPPLFE